MPAPDPPGHPPGLPRTPPDRLVVGRVLRPHGVRGELSVQVLSDAPERFAPGAELGVGDPDGPGPLESAVVQAARLHQGRLLLSLEGVEDRGAADRLRGAWLSIPVAAARPLDPGEFWPHQLVGLTVVDRQGRERGRVADVLPGAAHDLLAVELPGGASALVPAVAALVTVELEAGRVLVDAVPGLLGDNPEGSGAPHDGPAGSGSGPSPAPVGREGSGEPQGGAPVGREG
jgi:16S rRNA processing protein RimM